MSALSGGGNGCMHRCDCWLGILLCHVALVLGGCGGGADEGPGTAGDPGTAGAGEGASGTAAGQPPRSAGNAPDPVIDVDPTDYTNYLASRDDDLEDPVFLELKDVLTKYENGKNKRSFQLQIFANHPPRMHGEFREWWKNGQLWKKGQYEEGKPVGTWESYNDAGQLLKSGTYSEGRPDGEWSYFRTDGTLQRMESYRDGQRHGFWRDYDSTGKILLVEVHYQDGKRHGVCSQWYPLAEDQETPVKQREVEFVAGRQHGRLSEWYPNGQLRHQFDFRNGKRHGRAAEWDENGKLVNELQFRDGEAVN